MTSTVQPAGTAATEPRLNRASRSRRPSVTGEGKPAHWSVKLVVVIICFLWIVPAFGSLLTSFRTESDANATGWWTALHPRELGQLHAGQLPRRDHQRGARHGVHQQPRHRAAGHVHPDPHRRLRRLRLHIHAVPLPRHHVRRHRRLLIVPNFVAMVPLLQIYGNIGIGGTFLSVWLFHIGFGMSLAIYLFRNYMATLPREVIESAKIDGASHYSTFYRLILPMSTPVLASFAIFQFLWVWNDLLVALVFIGPGDNAPMTVAVKNNLIGQQGQGWNIVAAGGILTMILPIVIFLALQRYFVRGLTAGSVKG